jgi:hypothetical protein
VEVCFASYANPSYLVLVELVTLMVTVPQAIARKSCSFGFAQA